MEQKSIQFLMNLQQHCKQSQIFYEDTDKFLEYFIAKKEAETEKKNYVFSANAPAMQIDVGGFKLNFNTETVAALIAANQKEPEPIAVTAMPTAAYNQEIKIIAKEENNKTVENVLEVSKLPETGEEMKNLIKRKDGRWQGRKVVDGKRICVYARTQKECYEKLNKPVKREIKLKNQQSLYDFALWWLDTYKKGNITDNTYVGYKTVINAHLKIQTPLNRLTTLYLQEKLNLLPATRIKKEVYQLLRQIVRKAYELDLIKKDVSVFLEKGKLISAEKRALTLEEQRLLLKALSDDVFSRRIIFYLCTGARPNEISTIKREEMRPGWIKINGTKTQKSVRWVKVSEKFLNMVQHESKEFFIFNLKRFRERLQNFCFDSGIRYNVDVYTLRHTFATNLYILKVPEKDRQAYMGHQAGSKITNDVYTTFTPDVKPEDIKLLYKDLYPDF